MPIDLAWWLVVDDPRQQRDQLEKDVQRAYAAFDRESLSMTSTWVGRLGPFSLSVPVKSQVIVAIYVLFNVACFAIGVAFTLQHGALQALGIALVVGGLFSFGTLTAQWWDHIWQDQNNTMDRAFNSGYHDKRYAELQRLAKEWVDAHEKLEALAGPDSGDESPESHRSPASGPELDYQADAFRKGLIAQLGHLGDRQDGAARAQRDRIDEQSTERYDDQAATITDQTPGIIAALLTDPRTDHDTADPERTNPPVTAIGNFSFVIMTPGRGA
jgi:hypothetical protein